jgi:hypothetical protein
MVAYCIVELEKLVRRKLELKKSLAADPLSTSCAANTR